MASLSYSTLNFTNTGTTYSTFLTGIRGTNLVGMYVDANNFDHGLLYDLQLQTWTDIDFPAAVSTVPYGLSFGSFSSGMDIVGSYKLSGQQTDDGFLFDSSAQPGSQWTTLDYPSATNTIPHSTFGNLVVGNWDVLPSANPDFQTYPLAGNAFIYNITTQAFTTNNMPGAVSTTAYGIYDDLIAGGYDTTGTVGGLQPTHGYIYDMSTQMWHSYDHPGAIVTHFDGITGGGAPGSYTLIGDWLGASDPSGSAEHPFILQVKNFIPVNWIDFTIGSGTSSGNSVYGDTAIGIYTNGSPPANGYLATIPCFASGTRIATPRGAIAVERLREGDLVMTISGRAQPICWIGYRRIECRRHSNPSRVLPVRIAAHAFGPDKPRRDLLLSPDHAVFVDHVLIPIRHLINGSTIVQITRQTITYYHIELPRHDVLLADGMPAESYLETGARAAFANDGQVIQLYPDFIPPTGHYGMLWDLHGYAPLVVTGEVLERVRRSLADRSLISRRFRTVQVYAEQTGTN